MSACCLLGLTLTFYLAELSASYLSLQSTYIKTFQYMFLAVRMAVILSVVAFYLLFSQAFYFHQAWMSAKYLSKMSTCSIARRTRFLPSAWLSARRGCQIFSFLPSTRRGCLQGTLSCCLSVAWLIGL